jgi:hypothetical protein
MRMDSLRRLLVIVQALCRHLSDGYSHSTCNTGVHCIMKLKRIHLRERVPGGYKVGHKHTLHHERHTLMDDVPDKRPVYEDRKDKDGNIVQVLVSRDSIRSTITAHGTSLEDCERIMAIRVHAA